MQTQLFNHVTRSPSTCPSALLKPESPLLTLTPTVESPGNREVDSEVAMQRLNLWSCLNLAKMTLERVFMNGKKTKQSFSVSPHWELGESHTQGLLPRSGKRQTLEMSVFQ